LNLHPEITYDLFKLNTFMEMFTYVQDIKRFRPLIRISFFLGRKLSEKEKKIKGFVIRDWFSMALWYVRLKKAAKGCTPYKLLEIEERI